ncbi:MAG: PEP-utilizing enzyme mobile domain, partial [Myxococcales bacterium]|nr:PEP-utilizing enzyme mobile domain [Myxococcales bacterium]
LLSPVALVVETGGPLGHVAAQARERALPAVVDAPGASTAFRAGDLVLVDGDTGLAIRLAE